MRRRKLVLLAVVAVAAAAFVRVGYQPLGWGGYVYIGFDVPWRR